MDIDIDDFIEAGKVAARIRKESESLIMVGESLLEIAETIEKMIYDEGLKPAFPVNLSINDVAAHYTPEIGCTLELKEDDLLKVDMGIEVDGALSDTAYTVDLGGKYDNLVKASREALDEALKHIKPGAKNGEIGGIIEDVMKKYGVRPISNLTGHMILPNSLHAGVSMPNVRTNDKYEFKEGDIFAVEPFATDGDGHVYDSEQVEIFSLVDKIPVRSRQGRQILNHVIENYYTQPFAERWLGKDFPSKMLRSVGLKELLSVQAIQGYPVLMEHGKGMVAQFEHTILITDNGCRVLTK